MPFVATTPYPLVEDILQAARVLCNDAAFSISGDILSDSQPYIIPMVQACYRKLQRRLRRAGFNTFNEYTEVLGLTAVQSSDPTLQVRLTYTGYYDGAQIWPLITLPADMLEPLKIWERRTGSADKWRELTQAPDAINRAYQQAAFGIWDWEIDILFLPGATQSNDLKFKYLRMAPVLADVNSPVLIADCHDAMASLVAEMAALSRGGTEAAAAFQAIADNEINLLIAPQAKKEQRVAFVRKPFRSRGRR